MRTRRRRLPKRKKPPRPNKVQKHGGFDNAVFLHFSRPVERIAIKSDFCEIYSIHCFPFRCILIVYSTKKGKGTEAMQTPTKSITLLDGAVGTSLWEKTENKVPVWRYNIENPAIVSALHREFIDAGAEIILANTFGANAGAVASSPYTVHEVVETGVRLAREAAENTGVKVALSVGPLSTLLEPYGDLTEEEAAAIYEEQIGAGMNAGADLILLQTFMDVNMMAIAVRAAKQYSVPVFCAMTFEKVGKTMMGQSVQDVIDTLTPLGVDAVGLNCSLGPDLALPIIREFHERTDLPLLFKPNAGKPILAADGSTSTAYNADVFAEDILPAAEFVRYIGGCCGSNASYIRRLRDRLADGR